MTDSAGLGLDWEDLLQVFVMSFAEALRDAQGQTDAAMHGENPELKKTLDDFMAQLPEDWDKKKTTAIGSIIYVAFEAMMKTIQINNSAIALQVPHLARRSSGDAFRPAGGST